MLAVIIILQGLKRQLFIILYISFVENLENSNDAEGKI